MTPLPARPEEVRSVAVSLPEERAFQEVLDLIRASRERVLASEPLANATVLRGVPGPTRSLNAVEGIAMVSEPSCPYQV
jgi:hypothetical protein